MTGARLSLESAAARMTWMQIDGPTVDADAQALLARGIGGVVLFGRNIETPEQVLRLTTELRRRAAGPLRIAVDQEGGHIVRLGTPLTRFPSAMAIGATGSERMSHAVARATGEQLTALGLDVDLAPVLDVAADLRNPAIGVRAYGDDANDVASLGVAAIRGFLDAGVIPIPKHFPGHGRTPLDTHLGAAVVAGGLEALRALDLVPFRAAIAAGAPVVMVSQVIYAGVGEALPATLSRAIMRDLLRGELAFEGLTLTDAMVMDGVANGRSVPGASAQALIEGADVVMPLGHQASVLDAIERAIEDGRLGEARVAEALRRIGALDRFAERMRRVPQGDVDRPLGQCADHERLARDVARASLTLVPGSLAAPLARPIDASTSVALVEMASSRPSPIEDGLAAASLLAPVLGERLPRLASVHLRPDDPDRARAESHALELAEAAELVILATRDAFLRPGAIELVRRLHATGKVILHVALRSPYDLVAVAPPPLAIASPAGPPPPPAPLAVAAYADVPATLRALTEALTTPGPTSARFPGRLPVSLPTPDSLASEPYVVDLSA